LDQRLVERQKRYHHRAGGETAMDKIEADRYDPPRSTLNGLAKALRVKVEDPVR
jgi:hypothetical protein